MKLDVVERNMETRRKEGEEAEEPEFASKEGAHVATYSGVVTLWLSQERALQAVCGAPRHLLPSIPLA